MTKLCLDKSDKTDNLPCMRIRSHDGGCNPFPKIVEGLPEIVQKKLYKTMQTRGAQPYERVPYQNRVARWNRAVIPYVFRKSHPPESFQNGFTIMVRPSELSAKDFDQAVTIGSGAFVYYDNWDEYESYPPRKDWEVCKVDGKSTRGATRTQNSIHTGHYILRVPSTTSKNKKALVDGPPQGIRFFEYASQLESHMILWQLAYLAWNTQGIDVNKMPEHLKLVLDYYGLADDTSDREPMQ